MLPLPPPSPPFPFLGIGVLVLVYLVIFYLLNHEDHITGHDERSEEEDRPGLSMEEIGQLPWFYFHVSTTSSTSCAVCLDGFEAGERCRSFPVCNHMFHAQCIDLWFARKPSCPTCRSPFETK
ncbi:hypothetical protein V6N13_048140 [Hibiscus sabdariffa]|uniref:RING-type E3 ubiquitin transferase n=1 Tax=Hibiscus sabdariffa TaxID=183260 RepID=A0ABR2F6A5_9ROSI